MSSVQIALFTAGTLCLIVLAVSPFYRLKGLTDQLGTCGLALAALVGFSVLVLKQPEPQHDLAAIEKLLVETRMPAMTLQALQDARKRHGPLPTHTR